jgi:glyoxylase-like metal-dependent hydrolase (beta-lactamase superfamily II)
MEINNFILGEFETNCYVVCKNRSCRDCLIIDAGLQADELVEFLESCKLTPASVILTHGHADHIAGLQLLQKKWPELKVCIHSLDVEMLTRPDINLSMLAGTLIEIKPPDILLSDGQLIEQLGISLKVIHTPGHTPGGICLYSKGEQLLFSGDTLFAGSVGRTDFPGGNMQQLIKSVKEKLLILPDRTKVLPGHGPATTIGEEKQSNPFLQ